MRVNPILAESVVFVGIETERGFVPTGTGWLVAYPYEDFKFVFVATALHIFESLTEATQKKFVARVNRRDGTAAYLQRRPNQRFTHKDKANDVVLFSVEADWTHYDSIAWEMDRANIEDVREHNGGVAPGDHVCAIGLYTSHYGQISNKPVVRTGNVAAVADEPLWTERGFVEAHLIELRTIAGLSGSPVFQTWGPVRIKNGALQHSTQDSSGGVPLGMLIGYHVVQSKEDQITVPPQGEDFNDRAPDDSLDQRNTGFGLVLPVERILDIVEALRPLYAIHIARKKAAANVKFADVKTGGPSTGE